MKVILKRDIKNVGRAGEIVDVGDAYARNFVLANGYGVAANATAVQQHAATQARQSAAVKRQAQALEAMVARVSGTEIRLAGKANPQGKLFAALKSDDVRHELERQFSLTLPEFRCEPDHFKTIGQHAVTVWPDPRHHLPLNLIIDHAKEN